MKRLSPELKLAYGCGTVPMTAQELAFNYFLFIYYRQVLGLSGILVGEPLHVYQTNILHHQNCREL
ncbi:MAG: hypothetical protein ACYSUK_02690 [Planctomycetota bacterium]|jgi:Na+/melibiose symporter-like transporter